MGFQLGRAVGAATDSYMKAVKEWEEADRAREASERAQDANARSQETHDQGKADAAAARKAYGALAEGASSTGANATAAASVSAPPAPGGLPARPAGAVGEDTGALAGVTTASAPAPTATAAPGAGIPAGPPPVASDPEATGGLRMGPISDPVSVTPGAGVPSPAADEAREMASPDARRASPPAALGGEPPSGATTTPGGLPAAARPGTGGAPTTPAASTGEPAFRDRGPTIARLREVLRTSPSKTAADMLKAELDGQRDDLDKQSQIRLRGAQTRSADANARHADAQTRVEGLRGDAADRDLVARDLGDRVRVTLGAVDSLTRKAQPETSVADPAIKNELSATMDLASATYKFLPDKMEMSWKPTKLGDGTEGIRMTITDKEGKLPPRVRELKTVGDVSQVARELGIMSNPKVWSEAVGFTEASRYAADATKRKAELEAAGHPGAIEEARGLGESLTMQREIMDALKPVKPGEDRPSAYETRAELEAKADRAAIFNPRLITADKVTKNDDGTTTVTPGRNILRDVINNSLGPDHVTVKPTTGGPDVKISTTQAVARASESLPKLAAKIGEPAALAETEATWRKQGYKPAQVEAMKKQLRTYLEASATRSVTPASARPGGDAPVGPRAGIPVPARPVTLEEFGRTGLPERVAPSTHSYAPPAYSLR